MRIGIISDTHGNHHALQSVVDQAGPVDMWLHAGDHVRDAERLRELSGVPVLVAAGNCDPREAAPPDQFFSLGGFHIMLTHGHRYRVKEGLEELAWWGRQYEADIVVFGHTHKSGIFQEKALLLINPGSPVSPRGGSVAAFALLDLLPQKIQPTIVELTNNGGS